MSTVLSAGNRTLELQVLVAPDQELVLTQLVHNTVVPPWTRGFWQRCDRTPTFFINARHHDGTYAFDDLAAAVDAHLNSAISPV